MASGRNMDFDNNPDCLHSRKESNENWNDSILLPGERELGNSGNNKDSQHLFHQNHGNEPIVSQNLHFSSHQPFSKELNLKRLRAEQPDGISNIPRSFHEPYRHSSENASRLVQETKIFSVPQHKIRPGCTEDAELHVPSGTEFSVCQNKQSSRQDFCVQQPGENFVSHSPAIQSSDSISRKKRPLLSKRHNFTENECNTIRKSEQGVDEIGAIQGSNASAQQFVEFKRCDSQTQQQCGNKPIAPRSSYSLSHQPQNFVKKPSSASIIHFGNESSSIPAANIASYVPYSGESSRIQDLLWQSFRYSGYRSKGTRSLPPQGFHQPRNRFNWKSEIDLIQDCGLYSPMRETQNQCVGKQYLLPLSQRPVENFQLPGSSLGTGHVMSRKQNRSDKRKSNVIRVESVNLSILHYPYSNLFKRINIFVYGPTDWTSRFLQTCAGGIPLKSFGSCSLAFQRNITRCGILMAVSLWKIDSLESINLQSCLSTKSTIVLLLNILDKPKLLLTLQTAISLIRRDLSQTIPIILVGYKVDSSSSGTVRRRVNKNSIALQNMGFRLKAKYNLSAFLECSVDSSIEVEAVIFTALDVSHLSK